MVGTRGWRRGNWEGVFNADIVLIWEDKQFLEMDGGVAAPCECTYCH